MPSLRVRTPFDAEALLGFLATRAIPGVEEVRGTTYRRTLPLPGGPAVVELDVRPSTVALRTTLSDPADEPAAVTRCRALLDVDADPLAVDGVLGADPVLAPLVARRPGLRVPGAADPVEMAVRAVLGQQISVAGARTLAGRLVASIGTPLPWPDPGLTHVFPSAGAVAAARDEVPAMPAARRRTLRALGGALDSGDVALSPGADPVAAERALLALPGIGPWTAAYLRMRALGDRDVFLGGDLGVRKALAALGLTVDAAERWRPFRSYAVMHLWASLAS